MSKLEYVLNQLNIMFSDRLAHRFAPYTKFYESPHNPLTSIQKYNLLKDTVDTKNNL